MSWTSLAGRIGMAAVAGCALAGALRLAGVRRVVVEGHSMAPTLLPGDRLLVVPARRLSVGDLVAVHDPRDTRRLLIKRVAALHGATLEVRGDNPDASTDSRAFGNLSALLVVGRAVRRYAPPHRRGPVP